MHPTDRYPEGAVPLEPPPDAETTQALLLSAADEIHYTRGIIVPGPRAASQLEYATYEWEPEPISRPSFTTPSPDPYPAIDTTGRQDQRIRRERQVSDAATRTQQVPFGSSHGVPQLDVAVAAAGGQRLAIRREGQAVHGLGVSLQ